MVAITPDLIQSVARCSANTARVFAQPLTNALAQWEINTPARAAQFLAQTAHESQAYTRLEENMYYSEAALLRQFPTHFSQYDAAQYAKQPTRIANRVYANRMGNRDELSGDGWRYRGRGLVDITGHDEYAACGKACGADLLAHPDWLEFPSWAARSAGWYWHVNGLNELADAWRFEDITRRINGGTNGEASRLEYLARAKAALGIK